MAAKGMGNKPVDDGPVPFDTLTVPPCEWILYADVNGSGVHIWDIIIVIPNMLFLLFLVLTFRTAITKLKTSSSPIFAVFYALVMIVSVISCLRGILSMCVSATSAAENVANKVLWIVVRFFILATELSVVVFGLAFGHLDSRTSIRRVLIVTFSISLAYSFIQGTLELEYDHPEFKGKSGTANNNGTDVSYDLFAHGGMIFLFASSVLYFLVYSVILTLPWTKLKERFQLPTKKLFYYYCFGLAMLNLVQSVASMLLYCGELYSQCFVDATTYIYFTGFIPLIYAVFLYKFFRSNDQTGLHFSYKHQENLVDDDLSLPYSHAHAKQIDQAPIYSYDSTHFEVQFSQSGDSSTGHSTPVSINHDYYRVDS